jgi:transcriptional regulator with PAS, ATPase and Fis domain
MKTVFDIAQARLKAVESTDRILDRQREQTEELRRLRLEQDALLLAGTTDFFAAVHLYERELIKAALKLADKSLVKAAEHLGVSYQYLQYALTSRHQDLLPERRPIHKRRLR